MKLIGSKLVAMATAALLLILASCEYDDTWYPSGVVTVESYRETDTGGAKYCNVFYSVENTGNSKIALTVISIKATTTESEYYTTLLNDTPILPGMRIFGSFSLTYFSPTEALGDEEISVVDYSFE